MQNRGFIDTVIAAEQKVADQGDRLWKKLPGVRQDGEKKCQICINVSTMISPLFLSYPVLPSIYCI